MRRAGVSAAAGLGLLLVAFAFDSRTLFVPAIGLLVLPALSSTWIWLSARRAVVLRVLDVDRVIEEQPIEARIHLSAGWFGLPGAEIHDPMAGRPITLSSVHNRQIELRILARFPTRGRVRLPSPWISLRDPFGLATRIRPGSAAGRQELLVLPRTERINWLGGEGRAGMRRSGGGVSLEARGATELDGLRRYQRGTPASRIHWPALARGAGLLERRLLAEDERSPLVVLDARCPEPGELLDAAVRAAASLTLELGRREGCDLLLPGHRRPLHVARDLGAWAGAHARLALVEGGPDAAPPLLALPPRAGATFYVAAQPLVRAPLRAGEAGAGFIVVFPRGLSTELRGRPVFEVAACTGFLLEPGRHRQHRVRAAA